jgi:lipopolysaccharide transport system permease protein
LDDHANRTADAAPVLAMPPSAPVDRPAPTELPHTHIRPGGTGLRGLWKDLWTYHELLYFLAWRDIKVRYKQTAIGAAWAVLQPLLTMVAFSIFFGKLAGIDTRLAVPYPLFAFSALVVWQLFATGLNESANSVVANKHLATKVYFPRLVLPLAGVVVGVVDFAIACVLLLGLMAYYGYFVSLTSLLAPVFVLLAVASALSVGLWFAALNVRYRDVRYTLPFVTQFGMLVTPVAYPASFVPEAWRPLYGLNPMAGAVEGFRWALLGGPPPGEMVWVSTAATLLLFLGGAWYFRRTEHTFADFA